MHLLLLPTLLGFAVVACDSTEGNDNGGADAQVEEDTPPVDRKLGQRCSDESPCEPGLVCTSITADPRGTCFTACDNQGDSCTSAGDRTGACEPVATGGALVCVASVGNLEACGDQANAICDDTTKPMVSPPLGVSFCGIPCDPADPTTCTGGGTACGCPADLGCSTSPFVLKSGDGICGPVTVGGDTCGVDQEGVVHPCTNGMCKTQGSLWPGVCDL